MTSRRPKICRFTRSDEGSHQRSILIAERSLSCPRFFTYCSRQFKFHANEVVCFLGENNLNLGLIQVKIRSNGYQSIALELLYNFSFDTKVIGCCVWTQTPEKSFESQCHLSGSFWLSGIFGRMPGPIELNPKDF